jgi:tetratricopeptide (TPR) repeat protein
MCRSNYNRHRHRPKLSATGQTSPRTLAEWFEHGRRCFHKPDGVQAVTAMQKVTRLHPGYTHPDGDNPYYYLGKIHEVEHRLGNAIIFYSRALALDHLDEDSLIGRATCYTVTHQHEAAIHDLERLLRFPKSRRSQPDKHVHLILAENYLLLDRWGEAIFWREQAKDAAPGAEGHQMLYDSLLHALNRDFYME